MSTNLKSKSFVNKQFCLWRYESKETCRNYMIHIRTLGTVGVGGQSPSPLASDCGRSIDHITTLGTTILLTTSPHPLFLDPPTALHMTEHKMFLFVILPIRICLHKTSFLLTYIDRFRGHCPLERIFFPLLYFIFYLFFKI